MESTRFCGLISAPLSAHAAQGHCLLGALLPQTAPASSCVVGTSGPRGGALSILELMLCISYAGSRAPVWPFSVSRLPSAWCGAVGSRAASQPVLVLTGAIKGELEAPMKSSASTVAMSLSCIQPGQVAPGLSYPPLLVVSGRQAHFSHLPSATRSALGCPGWGRHDVLWR